MTLSALWLALIVGTVAVGAWRIAGRVLPRDDFLARGMAASILGWAWVTLGLQWLGPWGGVARGPMLAWSIIGGLSAFGLTRGVGPPPAPTSPHDPGWKSWSTLPLGVCLWAAIHDGLRSFWFPVKVVSDGPIYHLYFAVRWWKSGRLEAIPVPFGESAATYFPANGDLVFTWLLIAEGADRLARVGQFPFLILTFVASYGLCRQVGAGREASVIASLWFAMSGPGWLFSFEPNVDTIFTAGYVVAVYFLASYGLAEPGRAKLALAGLATGLAWGTKPTGTVFCPPLTLLGLVVIWRREPRLRERLSDAALLLILTLLPTGFWFLRNLWWTGNPLYPAHLELFGINILSGWYDRGAMVLSRYYIPLRRWTAAADILLAVLDIRLVPLWLAGVLGCWRIGRSGRRADGWIWTCAVLAVLNVMLYWLVIPYRTQQRFFLQGLALAAVPLASLIDRSRWLVWTAATLLVVHVLTPHTWPFTETPPGAIAGRAFVDLDPLVPSALPAILPLPDPSSALSALGHPLASAALGLLLVEGLAGFSLAWMLVRWTRSRGTLAGVLLPLLSLAVVLGVGLWFDRQTGASERVFPAFPDYLRAWDTLDRAADPDGVTVAYAGTDIPYYLFGAGLRNRVLYVNIDRHDDWLMHDYHRTAPERGDPSRWQTPRPGWDRIHPERVAWLRNLESAEVDMLVVARAKETDSPFGLDPEGFPIERRWAESDPYRFSPIYGVKPPDPEMKIYRFRPQGPTDRAMPRH